MSPGDGLLLYSDGVTEAHGAEREMFGTPRLVDHVADPASGDLIDGLLTQLQRFTGDDWEQEDDITLVTLTRTLGSGAQNGLISGIDVRFTLPSETGNEREAMQRVLDAIAPLGLESRRVDRLGTAVSEAAMNAIEHGNQGRADIPVEIEVVTAGGSTELRAKGMPLGLLPGMRYEEHEATMSPGDGLLLYSDGVTEAHGAEREMFGTPRLVDHVADPASGDLIDGLLTQLQRFTGDDWEQEDDITLVTLTRTLGSGVQNGRVPGVDVRFTLPSETGNEREAMQRVLDAIAPLGLEPRRVDRLGTAVSEAAMNAIEHGNQGRAEIPVEVEVVTADGELIVRICDVGDGPQATDVESPDIEAKLAGLQKPRGWGLFLIKNMVDEIRVIDADGRHTVELVLQLEGGGGDGSYGA
jgi:anti-sigma regulatory factor (Ser/Thr protein kinase)